MITTTYLPLAQAQRNADRARNEYQREARIGISPGALTYWYGEWAIASAILARIVDHYTATARDMGICTVCETEGHNPDELDSSSRCNDCRP